MLCGGPTTKISLQSFFLGCDVRINWAETSLYFNMIRILFQVFLILFPANINQNVN